MNNIGGVIKSIHDTPIRRKNNVQAISVSFPMPGAYVKLVMKSTRRIPTLEGFAHAQENQFN